MSFIPNALNSFEEYEIVVVDETKLLPKPEWDCVLRNGSKFSLRAPLFL